MFSEPASKERAKTNKRVTFTPSVDNTIILENNNNNLSISQSSESINGADFGEIPEIFRNLTCNRSPLNLLPNFDLMTESPTKINDNLVEAIDALDARLPLTLQAQQQMLNMQSDMLRLGIRVKELYKEYHRQTLMRYNIEQNLSKHSENLEKCAVKARQLAVAKKAYEATVAKVKAELATEAEHEMK